MTMDALMVCRNLITGEMTARMEDEISRAIAKDLTVVWIRSTGEIGWCCGSSGYGMIRRVAVVGKRRRQDYRTTELLEIHGGKSPLVKR